MRLSLLAASALAVALSLPSHALQPASDSGPVVVAQTPMADHAMHSLGDLMVESPWARATARGSRVGGAFLTIHNAGEQTDRLIAADSDVAARVQLHRTQMENGVMQMRHVEDGIEIPAGGMAELMPGGFHVMLMGLTAPLQEGSTFPVTLTFERAGSITIDVPVRAAGAMDDKMTHPN